ncbi:tetratricopeptide repeat protein [Plantactinospora sp. KLBMP9567]|uniref:tetratricopeptide repeat protein n=1 Tax=Plantactinospora sp. KLBMP9567 TaxID=3085900 RepID=UPI002980EC69|nr:tetratricopeptide repeat protein [Plantactinospora sp. KLBMP9567]MDW5324071.1 tetratricopeptide repeat protein [Plantactinospora sp. KLBMP9567]
MTAGAAGAGTDTDTRKSLLERALQLAQVGRVKAAYPLITEALRADPGDGYALQVLGYCYQRESRWGDMLTVLDMAARANPGSPQVQRNRSLALRQLGRISEALAAAELARSLDPDDARNELARAEALLRGSCTRTVLAALAATRRARELDPESVWAHVTEGKVQRRMAEFGRARAAYLEALRLAPDDPQALYGLATLDSDRGRAVRASPAMAGVLRTVPTDPVAIRAGTRNARRALWLLTDLGCVVLLLVAFVVGTLQEAIGSRPLAAASGVLVALAGAAAVLALLRWRFNRLSAPIRALVLANRYRFTFVTAPLRLAALLLGMLLFTLGPYPPVAVVAVGTTATVVPLLTLIVRWRSRAAVEVGLLVRRCWFRFRRLLSGG